jgi:hypothetical protein
VQVIRHYSVKQTKTKNELLLALLFGVLAIAFLVVPVVLFGLEVITAIVWVVGLVLLVVALWFGWKAWQKQQEVAVEDRLEAILAKFLGDAYIYFRNLVLPDTPSVGQIDGVLLGTHGAIVFQIETQMGEFICEGDTWYKYTGSSKPPTPVQKPLGIATIPETERKRLEDSPSWQVIRATREVKAWLSVRDLPQIMVQPVVVLSRGKLHSSKVPSCPIIQLEAIEAYLRSKFATKEEEIVNFGVVEQISLRLQAGK